MKQEAVNHKKEFYRALAALAVPIALQNLISAALNAADVMMLGFIGQEVLSAVSLANQVFFVLNLFYMGLTTGAAALSAQYAGCGGAYAVRRIYGVTLRCTCSVSALFFLAALLVPDALMRIFTGDSALIAAGAQYLRIVSVSYLVMGVSEAYLAVVRSVGRANTVLYIRLLGLAVNVLLNAVFLFGLFGAPRLGVRGVALATAAARMIELIGCLLDSLLCRGLRLRAADALTRDRALCRDYLRITWPAQCNYLVWGCGFSMYAVILGRLGSDAVAANAVVSVVHSLCVLLGLGVGSAGAILIGRELGDHRPAAEIRADGDRLCRIALAFGLFAALMMLAARPLALRVSQLSGTASTLLSAMLIMNSWNCAGNVLNSVTIAGIFCAGGDTKFGMFCDLLDMWCFTIPLAFLAAFLWRIPVVWVCFILSLDEIVKLPFVFMHYRKYRWIKNLTRDSVIIKEETIDDHA